MLTVPLWAQGSEGLTAHPPAQTTEAAPETDLSLLEAGRRSSSGLQENWLGRGSAAQRAPGRGQQASGVQRGGPGVWER